MNPDKNFERRKVLTELLEKMPFQFQFMSIDDDTELTPDAISKNHDSKRTIDSFGRVVSKYDSFDYTVLFFNGIHPKSLKSFNYDT